MRKTWTQNGHIHASERPAPDAEPAPSEPRAHTPASAPPASAPPAPAPAVAAGSPAAPVMADLGPRIRRLRQDQGLTLEDLAIRSGVSRAMLSKVERSEKSPSLSIAVGIAGGLNVSLSALLGSQPDWAKVRIARRGERITYVDPDTGFERSVLSPAHDATGVEILLHVIPPGKSSGVLPPYAVPTDKYIIVQAGELTVQIGDESYLVQAGDTFHFELSKPYILLNAGKTECQYYVIMVRKPI